EGEFDTDFRVDSNFYYLTGVDEAGAAVEVGPDADVLLLPPRNRQAERWEGPRLTAGTPAAAALGFREVRTIQGKPAGPDAKALDALAAMRLVKDEHELARLRRACEISALGLAEAARSMRPGMAEFEVDALVRYVFRREGAERAGYPSIIGSGPNSCILHYSKNTRRLQAGDLVVCDCGAEFGRYTADVTRTFPVSGRFTPEQRRVYDAVLRAQEAGIAAVKPGATVREVHEAARAVLREAGLDRYFFHGTSHWLGLDVHDVGDYSTPLAPGMVLTVEPGAYIAEKELGVRIEDDVLVTATGREVLSAAVPRTPAEIEALMAVRGVGDVPIRPLPAAPRPAADF
ncbi:MAG TPA: aminopeptidase P family protein, partial [Planctomycetota bacterium]|nr:aminopeptidase P family protein [Planctomycetota bacterium]